MNEPKANAPWKWNPSMAGALRVDIPELARTGANYSQAWQDIFVLSMLHGKKRGTYLEVGAQKPAENNNSCLLERVFGWTGASIEIDPAHFTQWMAERPSAQLVLADALAIDYRAAIKLWYGQSTSRIDYLQLDIDPASNTLAVLERMPLDEVRFSVITFETDAYTNDFRARDESRRILSSHGYELVGRDVTVLFPPISLNPIPFEDWWVDPVAVPAARIAEFKAANALNSNPQAMIFMAK